MDDENHDGVMVEKNADGGVLVITNIYDALKEDNPRNLFLNGQLHIENLCDILLSWYFCKGTTGEDNLRRTVFLDFLKSRDVDFFAKINLLRKVEVFEDGKMKRPFDGKVYVSLKAVGAVRNAFQHNLIYGEALKHITDGDVFVFVNEKKTKLTAFKSVDNLKKAFASEAVQLHDELVAIQHRLSTRFTQKPT